MRGSQGGLCVQCTGKALGTFALREEAVDVCLARGGLWGAVFHEEGSECVPGCMCLC